jgi:uncharacterized phage protein (TIGR01671 family)
MPRQIKFRLWDKGLNKMSYSSLHSISFDGKLQYGNADFSEYGAEIMQYTGLKDRHGIEIYEGDIVKFQSYGGHYEVKFEDGSFIPREIAIHKNEIIGNIYSNPELLK